MQPKLFISYLQGGAELAHRAEKLKNLLVDDGFDVFYDREAIEGSDIWPEKIFKNIRESSAVLLLIESKTHESFWVRREVDFARGAEKPILPIRLAKISDAILAENLEKFALGKIQAIDFITDNKSEHDDILKNVKRWLPAEFSLRYKRYNIVVPKMTSPCQLSITAGDFKEIDESIDVYVNSENDYMQMARFFETNRISSQLRRLGAQLDDMNRYIIHDTVQEELNQQVITLRNGLPICIGDIIVTGAGHPESILAKEKKARYIFHLASAEGLENGRLAPALQKINGFIRDLLHQTHIVNTRKGIMSPPNTAAYIQQEQEAQNYKPITNILLPLLGTGHARLDTGDVIDRILDGIIDYFTQHRTKNSLQEIFISAYFQRDAEQLEEKISKRKKRFEPIP